MTIGDWITVWTAVTVGGLAVFTIMAAWVTVAGLRDVRALYAALARSHARRGRRRTRRA